MDGDIYHQIMKEWYWLVIVGSIVAMAFCPMFLKAQCPKCKKRKLTSVEVDSPVRLSLEAANGAREFLTFYRCGACGGRLFRERTQPFQDASGPGWNLAFEPIEQVNAALVP